MATASRITSTRQFRAAVARGFREQVAGLTADAIDWCWTQRGKFPTGRPCITGEGTLPDGQHFLATCTLYPHGGHSLTVRLVRHNAGPGTVCATVHG